MTTTHLHADELEVRCRLCHADVGVSCVPAGADDRRNGRDEDHRRWTPHRLRRVDAGIEGPGGW